MPTIKARVISRLPDRDDVAFAYSEPMTSGVSSVFMRGSGTTSYVCGLCQTVLVENVFHGQVRNLVLECPKCHSFNEIP